MTPIENVFMLSIDAKLDYETLRQICLTGHSRVPVYEEIEVPMSTIVAMDGSKEVLISMTPDMSTSSSTSMPDVKRVKKIVGILLVKQVRVFCHWLIVFMLTLGK